MQHEYQFANGRMVATAAQIIGSACCAAQIFGRNIGIKKKTRSPEEERASQGGNAQRGAPPDELPESPAGLHA
jgi:hypothetical protein